MTPAEHIRTAFHAVTLIGVDTIDPVAERVVTLLGHGRRIALVHRHPHLGEPPTVRAGLTVVGSAHRWRTNDAAGFSVRVGPGSDDGFGFATPPGNVTAADLWTRWHADDRRDVAQVSIAGGLPDSGPHLDDRIVIRRFNSYGVCRETVVGFDHGTGTAHSLTAVHAELRRHMDSLADRQPWENKAILERLLAALDAHPGGER